MKEDWKECKLGEVCEKITDGSHFSPKATEIGYPMFSVKDMQEYGFDYSNCKYISAEDFKYMKKNDCVPKKGDILVAKDGSFLKQIFKCKEDKEEAILSSIAIFRPNKKIVLPNFLCYLLKTPKIYNYIASNCVSGSALPRIVLKDFKNVIIPVPPLATQQKIATILSSLDDKIELNNKINQNLEQQAQAIFKSWFVDFEPFGGKMPEGWKEVKFRDICENITDGVHNTVVDDPNGEYLLLSCKNIKGGILTIASSERKINKETFERLRKRTKLAKGDILLSSVGTVGEMYLLNETPNNYEFQRSVAIIKPNTTLISPAFLYESMLFQKDTIIHSAHGAVQQCIFISDVGDFTTILPTLDVIEKFTNIVQPMLETITANQHENRKLSNMRDTLLPKLMNGEIEVNKK